MKKLMSPPSWLKKGTESLTDAIKKKNPFSVKAAADTLQKNKSKKKAILDSI